MNLIADSPLHPTSPPTPITSNVSIVSDTPIMAPTQHIYGILAPPPAEASMKMPTYSPDRNGDWIYSFIAMPGTLLPHPEHF